MTLTAGSRLGVYEVLQPLGAGGMGQVYKARDTRLNRTVAIKVLGDASTDDASAARRLLQEARAVAALDHPNICAVYEVGEHDGCGYIVMPYIAGETLAARLRRKRLDLGEVLDLAVQAAEALAEAHAHGIIHRDVKPQNIMVTPKGQVKVLDFGLATVDAAHQTGETRTMTASRPGSVAGTLAYMSPEQTRGDVADARSDVFSFGVVLDEMLAGQDKPPELARIVGKCLERDRDRRYQSLREVATDLDNLRQQRGRREAFPAVGRRRRVSWTWMMVAALIVAAVGGVSWWRRARSSTGDAVRTLAVLPLRPLSDNVTENHIGLGIANSVIAKVSGRGLTVRPTSAVHRYAKEDASSLDVAQQLDVDAVLEGAWQRDADRLRVTVHLLRTSDGSTIWTDTFNMDWSDVFTVEDRVSQELASRLHLTLDPSTEARVARRRTSNPLAYEYFTRGLFFFGDRDVRASALRSIEMFEQAVRADPRYALAHAQLGYAYAWRAIRQDGDAQWIGRAKEAIRVAEALDGELPEVPLVRAFVAWSQFEGWQVDEAIHQIYLAQRLDPAAGHNELAELYFHIGLEEPAEREHERAIEADPTSDVLKASLINEYYLSARPDEARAAENRFSGLTGVLPVYFLEERMPHELRPIIEANLAKNPESASVRAYEALLLTLEGRYQEAEGRVPGIVQRAAKNRSYHHVTYNIARIYAGSRRVEPALTWLQTTCDEGFPQYQLFRRDQYLDPIRNDPRFAAWLDGARKKWEQYRRLLIDAPRRER